VPYFAIESITDSEKADQHKNKKYIQQCLVVVGIIVKGHFTYSFIKKEGQKAMKTESNKKESAKNEFFRMGIKVIKKEEPCRKDYHHGKRHVMIVFPVN